MHQLVAGVGEKRVNHGKLPVPEILTIRAQVGQQRVGLLGEGRQHTLLDVGVVRSVDNAVAHLDEKPEVIASRFRPHEQTGPGESF